MNKLPESKRIKILNLLVEGSSMRSISRVEGVSIITVMKLLVDAGKACARLHDELVRDVPAQRVEVDEVWAFCYAKQKTVAYASGAPDGAGDAWTWTGIDPDSKLIVSWYVSPGRGSEYALEFMDDLRARLANRVQLTTDGYRAYLEAVEGAFGGNVDYAQLMKIYRPSQEGRYSPAACLGATKRPVVGYPDADAISTSIVERHNLTTRMSLRRFTRLTNAFSKKLENHRHAVALYTLWYNWIRPHKSLGWETPAMVAGLADERYGFGWILRTINAN